MRHFGMEVKHRTRRQLVRNAFAGQLEQQVAPGKNRLIYLWGHLTAVNDGLLPLLGIGERLSSGTPHNVHFETG